MTSSAWVKKIKKNYVLYLFILPAFLYVLIFHYFPLYGIQIAFKDFSGIKGIWGSEWVGLKHFKEFIFSPMFGTLIKNTLVLSIYSLIAGFPIPIILALLLNSSKNKKLRSVVQTLTYAPYFISTVVFCGMLLLFLSPTTGIINKMIVSLGGESVNFMQEEALFPSIYVWSGIWQTTGWSSIIYLSALSGISPSLHEAAVVDGATRLQRIRYIDFPGIIPTAVVIFLLNMGNLMSVGFEKVYLLQNSMNITSSEIISTYVYKMGILNAQYSFSTAVSLFNNLINILLLLSANRLAKRYFGTSLW